ncbi:MAG: alpha/beta hydrolase [Candidatus Woesearchaeota archaeon]
MHEKTSKIMPGAESFFYKKGRTGVLLVHGFTSTPQEMRYLGEFLKKNNISVYCPLLKGHGTKWEEMAQTGNIDWLKSIDDAYLKLKKYCNKIFIAGSSYGANLAVINAAYNPTRYKGIIIMSMPVELKKIEEFILLLTPFLSNFKKTIKKRYPKDKNVMRIQKTKIHYPVVPLKNAADLMDGILISKDELKKINIPALVMQSKTDHHFGENTALKIMSLLKTQNKTLKFIPNSYHVFVLDKYRHIAFKYILDFINKNK